MSDSLAVPVPTSVHAVVHHHIKCKEEQKNRKLVDMLDALEFNLVVIYAKTQPRCEVLHKLLKDCNFPTECIPLGISEAENLVASFHSGGKFRILVSSVPLNRAVDKLSLVVNYDMSNNLSTYLSALEAFPRPTKTASFVGMAISFVSSDEDEKVLNEIRAASVTNDIMPEEVDPEIYMAR